MATGDVMRHWALALRALLESTDMTEVEVRNDRVTYEYVMGRGLRVYVDQGDNHPVTADLPESALDEEKWMVAGA